MPHDRDGRRGGRRGHPAPDGGQPLDDPAVREKEVGPKKVATIISDGVAAQAPPYGYILAAPVHFSKAAHTTASARSSWPRGVHGVLSVGRRMSWRTCSSAQERPHPVRLFGLSLATRRLAPGRLRSFHLLAKNKLMRVLGDRPVQRVLTMIWTTKAMSLRGRLPGLRQKSRWKEYKAHSFDPCGLVVTEARHFAYLDREGGEWDSTELVDEDVSLGDQQEEQQQRNARGRRLLGTATQGPPRDLGAPCAASRFDAIAYIDDKGDSVFDMPHLYVPYEAKHGPFAGFHEYLEINEHTHIPLEGLTRKAVFPDRFSAPSFGTAHSGPALTLDAATHARLQHGRREVTPMGRQPVWATEAD